jgi:predicted Fe-Mo cluster-binding NifX family protein
MKIAVTSSGPNLDAEVDPRFGRCQYFLIVELNDLSFEAIENSSIAAAGGAGIQSAQFMAEKEIKAVITGNCGPNAYQTLSAAGIEVIVGAAGIIRDVLEMYRRGELAPAKDASVSSHFGIGGSSSGPYGTPPGPGMGMGGGMGRGMGGGMGRGMGRGMGGGMGRGMGRGMGMMGGGQMPGKPMSRDEEISALEEQANTMSEQLYEIQRKIKELKK